MNIVDFCKKFSLNYQPVELILTPSKKEKNRIDKRQDFDVCNAKTNDFRNPDINKEEIERRKNYSFNHIAIHTDKKLCVIDVDFKDDIEYSQESIDWVEKMKLVLPYKKSTTLKRGYHLYFINDNNIFNIDKLKHTPYFGIEILAGQWAWEKADSVIYNVGEVIPKMKLPNTKNNIEMTIAKKDNNNSLEKSLSKKDNNNSLEKSLSKKDNNMDPVVLEWIRGMEAKHVHHYDDWFKVLCKIKKCGEQYKEEADILSQKDKKQYGDFEKTWNKINVNTNNSILNNIVCPATDFYDLFKDSVVVNCFDGKNEVYCYNENTKMWKRDDKLCLIKFNIGKLLNKKYSLDVSIEENEEVKKKKLNILLKEINSNVWRTNIANTFICEVLGNQFENVDFDAIDYLYHFKNTTFDLRDLSFRQRRKEDYCTMFGCHLEDRNEEKIAKWEEIITSIFPDEKVRKTYKEIIINSFSGVVLQKFIVFNGSGSNGKSMLDNCFKHLHNDYYYKGSCSDLCQPSKGGANPSLANCNKKRFCIYTEPNEKEKMNISTIKDMTGEDSINARKNYSNDTNTKMGGIKIVECNKRLKLSGDTGFSLQRRLIDLLYSSTFKTSDGITSLDTPYDKDNNPSGYQLANTEYETKEWREEYCSDLFYYLLDFMKREGKNYSNMNKFVVCNSIKKRTTQYIEDNNDFLHFISRYCEPSKGEYVKLKELKDKIHADFEYMSLLSKTEKRNLTFPKLRARLLEDPQLGSYFKDRVQINGTRLTNVLFHYKLIGDNENEGDSDSDSDC